MFDLNLVLNVFLYQYGGSSRYKGENLDDENRIFRFEGGDKGR
jgi:hypothetical protein